ncbi:MAG: extracellular solute-binding protein [Planctomycetes bacterium]|nr:extracellular solute-binding protein [Planctomycetota bacterium]
MRRSHGIIFGIIIASAACFVRFGGDETPEGRLRMAVWGMPFEDRLFEDGYARDFEQLHPGVSIKYGRYEDVTAKYYTWHLLKRGADVMRVPITDYHALVTKGVLAPLDRFINDPEVGLSAADQADFTPAIWDALLLNGQRYALPSDNAQFGLYYNVTIFERYNRDHPNDPLGFPSASWSWEDLREAADKLTRRADHGRIVQYGVDFTLWAWPFMTFFAQAGGELWDDAKTTTLINSPPGVEALQLIVDLLPHGASMRSGELTDSATGPDKLFGTGQTAILLDGSWRAPFLEQTFFELEFGIAPLPSHRRSAIVSGSVLWAVSAHSQNKPLAWEMIRWMTNREQSLRYWKALRVAPPGRMSVIRSPEFAAADPTAGTAHDRTSWLAHAITVDPASGRMPGFVPVGPYQQDLEDKITAMLLRAVSRGRDESLAQLLDRAAAAVHSIIDRDRRARRLPPIERE